MILELLIGLILVSIIILLILLAGTLANLFLSRKEIGYLNTFELGFGILLLIFVIILGGYMIGYLFLELLK